MKVERVSYDVITPSAARGVLEAIYWKPQMRWIISRLHVLSPIKFTSIRRNEIDATVPVHGKTGVNTAMKRGHGQLGIAVDQHRQQRSSLILQDVAYVIEARIEVINSTEHDGSTLDKPEAKHLDSFRRRAEVGGHFHQPYLGTREFPAKCELVEGDIPSTNIAKPDHTRDLGFMLHDFAFDQDPKTKKVKSATPHFFRAEMKEGVIEVPPFSATTA